MTMYQKINQPFEAVSPIYKNVVIFFEQFHQTFQVPKMEVLTYVCKAYVREISPPK